MSIFKSSRWLARTSAATIAALSLAALAACGSGSTDSGTDSNSGSGGDESAAEGDGELSGDIVFWHSFTQGARMEYMQRMADEFMEENPNVTITIEAFAWPEFYTKWTTGLQSGQVPDISTALPLHVVEMLDAGAIAPVDSIVDSIGRDRFSESALNEASQDGANYGVPLYSHAQVMWYRQDLLDAAGLEIPTTWDELATTAQALTTPDVFGLSVPMGSNDLMSARFLNFYLKSAGESLLNEDGTANLTSQAALDGIQYWVDMYRATSPKGSVNFNVLDQATLYYQGDTAFDFNSGFQIAGVASTTPDILDYIGAAPLPRMAEGDPIYGAETSNIQMVVWEQSDVKEASEAFIETLYEKDDYITFLHSVPGGMLPALSDIAEDPAYLDDEIIAQFTDTIGVIQEAVPLGTAIGMENGPTLQAGILTNQGIIEGMFQDIVLNNTPVADAAAAAEEQLNSIFRSSGLIS